ncbi:SDR family NAD(P)-dependent oxidoreductase [Streptomyces sp. G5(2025)]|uniref:SDR family NAD(P)-dependent oxidoreductase n=1 Tax=Streptomyces sp. G5(2025) TaxID=3406628 RepID=UPI003C2072E5
MSPSRAVLITGVNSRSVLSSGTGRATALRLHRAGLPVYATGRSLEGLRDLADEGITTLQVDVTDEESMAAAVKRVTEEHGAVGVLVNNAAYSLNGTIGETPVDAVRAQFETNFFGLSRMTQLVLPGMREQRSGRIVMMSSIFGLFATPGRGYYQATKHALEAISDALRLEVASAGIKVVVIEPSPILGSFVPTSTGDLGLEAADDLYAGFGNGSSSGTVPTVRWSTPRGAAGPPCERATSPPSWKGRSPRPGLVFATGWVSRSGCCGRSAPSSATARGMPSCPGSSPPPDSSPRKGGSGTLGPEPPRVSPGHAARSQSAALSPIMIEVRLVFARTVVGMIDASQT